MLEVAVITNDAYPFLAFSHLTCHLTCYLSVIQKDLITHVHGLAVCVKEGLPFAWGLSLGNSADCYICFRLPLLH